MITGVLRRGAAISGFWIKSCQEGAQRHEHNACRFMRSRSVRYSVTRRPPTARPLGAGRFLAQAAFSRRYTALPRGVLQARLDAHHGPHGRREAPPRTFPPLRRQSTGERPQRAATDDERGIAAAGAGRGAGLVRGRQQDRLLWRVPQPVPQVQALRGAGEVRWQASAPGQLRHRRGGGTVHRAIAGGAVRGGAEGSSVTAAADERGGAAAGAGGGAGATRFREQDGLLWCVPQSARQAQALRGAGVARWQGYPSGALCHRRGGGAVRRAIAGGAVRGGKGCSGAAADERGGAAAGAGGGADPSQGHERDGFSRRASRQARQDQALPGAGDARRQGREPGPLCHRRGGGAVRGAAQPAAQRAPQQAAGDGGGREGRRSRCAGTEDQPGARSAGGTGGAHRGHAAARGGHPVRRAIAAGVGGLGGVGEAGGGARRREGRRCRSTEEETEEVRPSEYV
eukprot:scaffold95011_cov63-Phaeocystis_antarctica.AAC.3